MTGQVIYALGDGGNWPVQVRQEVQELMTQVKGHALFAGGD